ncbi:MAG: cytochrome c oxidase cbb3-type subunit 1 [Planctomycetota bacterium]|jgi:cytochrome c oxidase cbb3-type subunit 1
METDPHEADRAVDVNQRAVIDRSAREVVLLWYGSSVFWLLLGSVLALITSIKLHTPGFLDGWEWLTFGRVRPAHLNTVIYGWASMSGIGTLLWLMARLCKIRLPWREGLILAGVYWNAMVAIGTFQILIGNGTSIEWLEFPWWISIPLGLMFLVLIALTVKMLRSRQEKHLYVSQWYLFGATIWFPFLYVAATILIHSPAATGVAKATANWWFAHNVLGLWLTPIGLASAYYFIPKVLGRPIHSYYLSIIGFWSLALFYNWAGTHHLIGGPLPAWLVTVGTVGSMMMFVPVITVAVNHHLTMAGNFSKMRFSPTLRFIVFGAMSYTAVSVQGSLTALRMVNEVGHFTHYTIAHAHLGVYSFYSMIAFGSMYYVMPRLVEREWVSSRLIKVHFWTCAVGIIMYWVGLSFGGWMQGLMMNNPDVPFMDVVQRMIPYLWSRSIAGTLMTIGHFSFAVLVWKMIRREGAWLVEPTLFVTKKDAREAKEAQLAPASATRGNAS